MSLDQFDYSRTFFVLDFDRCMANTDKFHDILMHIIERETTTITAKELHRVRSKAEQIGQSFDTIEYVRRALAESGEGKNWQKIQQIFIREAQTQDMLEPHVADLFRILDKKHIPYGIITYGGDAWQLAKIEAARLINIPHVVTHIVEKGQLLTGWKRGGGTFIIPPVLTRDFHPLTVSSIIFLDDKARSFVQIPKGVQGVHVLSSVGAPLLPSQRGTLPPHVTSVKGVLGAIALLFPDEHHRIIDKS